MKKFFLSAFVVVTFIAYALNQKLTGSDQTSLVTPVPTANNTQQTFSTIATPAGSGTPNPTSTPISAPTRSGYKDGQFTGVSADAYYGNIQVKVRISGGKIADVQFLDYPHDRNTSMMINSQAMPYLKQEAIQAQSAQVDIVSGATDSSLAFRQSLQSALDQAR